MQASDVFNENTDSRMLNLIAQPNAATDEVKFSVNTRLLPSYEDPRMPVDHDNYAQYTPLSGHLILVAMKKFGHNYFRYTRTAFASGRGP